MWVGDVRASGLAGSGMGGRWGCLGLRCVRGKICRIGSLGGCCGRWGVVLVFPVGPLPIGPGVQGVRVLVGFQARLECLDTSVFLGWYWIVGGRPRWLVGLFHGLV